MQPKRDAREFCTMFNHLNIHLLDGFCCISLNKQKWIFTQLIHLNCVNENLYGKMFALLENSLKYFAIVKMHLNDVFKPKILCQRVSWREGVKVKIHVKANALNQNEMPFICSYQAETGKMNKQNSKRIWMHNKKNIQFLAIVSLWCLHTTTAAAAAAAQYCNAKKPQMNTRNTTK